MKFNQVSGGYGSYLRYVTCVLHEPFDAAFEDRYGAFRIIKYSTSIK